jgi:hypothetical protein
MKRWDANSMLELGKKLFAKIHRQKKHANHNHDVHIMAREIDESLPQGIQSLIDGTYDPRCLKRYCFEDEVVDRVFVAVGFLGLVVDLFPQGVERSGVHFEMKIEMRDGDFGCEQAGCDDLAHAGELDDFPPPRTFTGGKAHDMVDAEFQSHTGGNRCLSFRRVEDE